MSGKKVVVGISGGVDSSVAAARLLEQGYDVTGAYLTCWEEPGCRTDQDRKDALKVATQLGIPFEVLDFRREYRERVVDYFYGEYAAGRTPNPDVVCNREVKFGMFYDWAMAHAFDYVATGHYARIVHSTQYAVHGETQFLLQRPRDLAKDQTYFLWEVAPEKLDHVLFPLGDVLKSEVRSRAKELGLPTAEKPDSMGICFIGEVDVTELLRDKLGEQPGDVVRDGTVIGTHKGLWFHTIGQRGGWDLFPTMQTVAMPPLYVIEKNVSKNQLIVGTQEQTRVDSVTVSTPVLYVDRTRFFTRAAGGQLYLRIRNLGALCKVRSLSENEDGALSVSLDKPLFGVALGQSAVFYSREDKEGEEIVAGGGIIR